jgi:hypothetical protein
VFSFTQRTALDSFDSELRGDLCLSERGPGLLFAAAGKVTVDVLKYEV